MGRDDEDEQGATPQVEGAASDPPVRRRADGHLRRVLRQAARAGGVLSVGLACECGEVVCDPLPPPVQCSNIKSSAKATAAWAKEGEQMAIALQVEAYLSYYGYGQSVAYGFSDQLQVVNGRVEKVVASNGGGGKLTLTCNVIPDAGAKSVWISIAAHCQSQASQSGPATSFSGQLDVTLPIAASPMSGDQVEAQAAWR